MIVNSLFCGLLSGSIEFKFSRVMMAVLASSTVTPVLVSADGALSTVDRPAVAIPPPRGSARFLYISDCPVKSSS